MLIVCVSRVNGLLSVFRVEKSPDKDVYGIKLSNVNDISGHRFKVSVNGEVKSKTQLYLLGTQNEL